MKYPTRCRIVDVDGGVLHGLRLKTPEKSRPHIGEEGNAEMDGDLIKITLDDGSIIYGHECWWVAI